MTPLLPALPILIGLVWTYVGNRVTPLSALLTLAGALGLIWLWRPLRVHSVAAAVLLLNLSLGLLYYWSLDETHHVVVHVTPTLLTAQVDGDTTTLARAVTGSGWGFQEAGLDTYRIQATGEAIQTDTTSLMGRIAGAMRLAGAGPGWANLRITLPNGSSLPPQPPQVGAPLGSWSRNSRGEWVGPPGDYLLFPPVRATSYVISADLVRPDGAQNLLLGVGPGRSGVTLQVRFDQPDALWASWASGTTGGTMGGTGLSHIALVASVQRDVRIFLTGYLYALLLAALALGVYIVLLVAFAAMGSTEGDDFAVLERVVRARAFSPVFFVGITLTGSVATGLVATFLLDRMPHVQDSVAYLFQAKIFALGRLHVPAPPAAIQSFFAEEYMPMYHGNWFSQYPPGHPLMMLLGVLAGAPWLVEPILAALALALIYLVGERVYGRPVGVIAALLGLTSPFWLFLGSSMMSHATGLFFIVACFLAFALAEQRGSRTAALLAGFLAGMAFLTRELTAVGALAPLAVYAAFFSRRSWRTYLPAVPAGLLYVAAFLLYNWGQMGDPLLSTYAAWSSHYVLGFGPNVSPAGLFTAGDGAWNVYQNLAMLAVQLYGWPYAIALAFLFLPFILGAARRWDYLLLASFLGIVVVYAFYWCACLMYGPRFYYEALGPLLLLTARGIVELVRLPGRLAPRLHLAQDRTLAAFFPLIVMVALVLYGVRWYLPGQIPLYQNYNYSSDAGLQAVAQAHVHHAIVFVVSNPPGFWSSYGNVFFANNPLLHGNIIYARDEVPDKQLLYRYFPGRAHYRLNGATLTRIS